MVHVLIEWKVTLNEDLHWFQILYVVLIVFIVLSICPFDWGGELTGICVHEIPFLTKFFVRIPYEFWTVV